MQEDKKQIPEKYKIYILSKDITSQYAVQAAENTFIFSILSSLAMKVYASNYIELITILLVSVPISIMVGIYTSKYKNKFMDDAQLTNLD